MTDLKPGDKVTATDYWRAARDALKVPFDINEVGVIKEVYQGPGWEHIRYPIEAYFPTNYALEGEDFPHDKSLRTCDYYFFMPHELTKVS